MKLQWIVKQWLPHITTYSWHGRGAFGGHQPGVIYAGLLGGPTATPTPFISSHAAAASWAVEQIGKSLDLMARNGRCAICGRPPAESHDSGLHYIATIKGPRS